MTPDIQLDAAATSVLSSLQALFGPHGTVTPVHLKTPGIVEEFRPGGDTDLADVPRPVLDWVFGVQCGAVHGDARLCGLVFTQFSRLEAFYAENPPLCGTLVTRWHGAAAIWLRATGRIPRDFTADGVHWRIGGIIPVGCPKQLPETFISQLGEIKLVEFNKLVWSEQQQAEIGLVFLEMEVGAPFRTVARGRRVLNLGFWARYFTDMMLIAYDPDRNSFTWGDSKVRQPELLTVDATTREFTNLLQVAAPSFGAKFPQGEIRPARVRQLVERVKLLTIQPRASDDEVFDSFLASQVVVAPGKNTTSQEFRAAFVRYCGKLNRVPAPAMWFHRKLGPKLRAQFGVTQRHDVVRNGTKVRGYAGLALRQEVATQRTDGTDGADGA